MCKLTLNHQSYDEIMKEKLLIFPLSKVRQRCIEKASNNTIPTSIYVILLIYRPNSNTNTVNACDRLMSTSSEVHIAMDDLA